MSLPLRTVTWRLWLAYRGDETHGFQQQSHCRTVQQVLQEALARLAHEPVVVTAAGRTDAGVAACGQAVSCRLTSRLDARKMVLALAHLLPPDVSVWRADEMPQGFDARRHSIGKRYIYRIEQTLAGSPFDVSLCWRLPARLDLEQMQRAAGYLVGDHDFGSFRSVLCTAAHAQRFLWRVAVHRYARGLQVDVRGNAFCHHMVRIIVGTLASVGRGKLRADDISAILAACCRQQAGPTAPARGLTLQQVYYPDDLEQAEIPHGACFPRYPVSKETWPWPPDAIRLGPTMR